MLKHKNTGYTYIVSASLYSEELEIVERVINEHECSFTEALRTIIKAYGKENK